MTALLQHPGYDEERLKGVAEKLPCREVQAEMLLSLMGQVRNLHSSPFNVLKYATLKDAETHANSVFNVLKTQCFMCLI